MLVIFVSCEKDQEQELIKIEGIALDAISFTELEGAEVVLQPSDATRDKSWMMSQEGEMVTTVDNLGNYTFDKIAKGKYSLSVNMEGYKPMFTSEINLDGSDQFIAFLPAETSFTLPVGGITGMVVDNNGDPVQNANISISARDESITNGYFSSTDSNENGEFFIGAIPVDQTNEFKIRCIADDFKTIVLPNLVILENEMRIVYCKMQEGTAAEILFYEDFEDQTSWDLDGFWQIKKNTSVTNQAYPVYVKLAPNDESEGMIPDAYKGNRSLWYGETQNGNFMGEQSSLDEELSGGTSTTFNSGTALSPVIDLSDAEQASVNFLTWFEIESKNPNNLGYDLMEIYAFVEDESPNNATLLGKLNPYAEPILDNREAIPFTSGGFNKKPVWGYVEFDLSEFAGNKIHLKFVFDTRDELYNGFRGWIIDEIIITDKAILDQKSGEVQPGKLMERDI
ncbi:MAG: hypothetical protein ACOCUQ_00720 [Bacteroidota bacterium]